MKRILATLGALCVLGPTLLSGSAAATINSDTAWAREYDGPVGGVEYATALEIDAAGNVYVSGTSPGSGTGLDWATLKYDPDGVLLWEKRYDGPASDADTVMALWVDGSGNVYVTGGSVGAGTGLDYATLKYDTDGSLLWERRYNGPASLGDQAYALFVDDAGNVYVTGHSYGLGTGPDYATIKYDAAGTELWVRRFNGNLNESDTARAIQVDGAGNVYVTGSSVKPGEAQNLVTLKYDAAGVFQWDRRYNGTGNLDDRPFAMTLDADANVYVTGSSWGSGTRDDYVTLKYDTDGNLLWERRYDGIGLWYDAAFAILVDAAQNVYVTGGSDGPAPHRDDITTLKYDASGTLLWERRYDGPLTDDDAVGYDLELGTDGNLYVGGFSDSVLTDFTALIYEPDGDLTQIRRFNQTMYTEDQAFAMAVDDAGYIYLTGVTNVFGAADYSTVKLLPCSCPYQADADLDGFITVIDLAAIVDILFGSDPDLREQGCPSPRFDYDCDGFTTALDMSLMIDRLFAIAIPPCDPCAL